MLILGALATIAGELDVRFSPIDPAQGDPLVVYVRAPGHEGQKPVGAVEIFGLAAPLLPAEGPWLRAFIAVPLEASSRSWPVRITVGSAGTLTYVTVREKAFRTSRLRVSDRFTDKNRPLSLERRLKVEAEAWDALFAPSPGPLRFDGELVWPVRGSTTSEFGVRRTYNGKLESVHYGLDLEGRIGDAVVAAQSGAVVMSAMRFNTGGTVVLDHGNGLFTAYFHLSRRTVKVGQVVRVGAPLGRVGATGRVTGPHLHLAAVIRMVADGEPRPMYVDPERILELVPQ